MAGKFETTLYEVADRIATITLNRPEQLNAFSVPAMREFIAALDAADSDDDVRVIIITGAGKAFCAGADISRGPNSFDYASYNSPRDELKVDGTYRDSGGFMTLRLYRSNKPVIAAINGAAAGVGATMPLAADIRLAADDARFVFPFVRRGIVPESCSSWFLPRIVGISKALKWCLSGSVISSSEALASGLVEALYPRNELLPAARAIASEIAKNTAPVAVALTRQMMWRMLGASHPMEAHRVDSRAVQHCGSAPDTYEGVGAFLEKRQPEFGDTLAGGLPDVFQDWVEPEFR
jgi:enoyl-CoA hydratase/carnithine racemase